MSTNKVKEFNIIYFIWFHWVSYVKSLFMEHKQAVLHLFFSLSSQTPVAKELIRLLKIPIDSYKDILVLLKLKHFGMVVEYLDYEGRKTMGCYLVNNAIEQNTKIPTQEQVDQILLLVAPLVQDQVDQPQDVSICLQVVPLAHKSKVN